MSAPGRTVRGIGVGRGSAVGPAVLVRPGPGVPVDEPVASDPTAAGERVEAVLTALAEELRARAAATDGVLADTLDAAATMAEDPALLDETRALIGQGHGPATALDRAARGFAETFTAVGGYLAERVTDLMSVRDRAVARLLGLPEPGMPALEVPSVIIADDLSPADTASVDLAMVVALVTERGGPTGHTAIVAGQLGIPCVVGAEGATAIPAGARTAVDAADGVVVVDPSDELVVTLADRAARLAELESDTADGATADGHRVSLLANIGTPADAVRAASSSVEGVGLFRTEVLFLDNVSAPTVEAQTEAYRQVFDAFPGRKVVVRTLDAGADKPLAFASLADEENPALGVRGFRTSRVHPGLLADQLTALARAAEASSATVWVMAPMIAVPDEARAFAELARERGVGSVGVMVEVPSAALLADDLLDHVDFLSIGTNDLAQYTMAADRLSTELSDLTDAWQPAILRLVGQTAAAGMARAKPVGVCGESAADPFLALVLVGLGVTSLSMSPPAVAPVRYALRRHTLAECRAMAEAALGAASARSARDIVVSHVHDDVRATLGR